jgi:hypothetical protein
MPSPQERVCRALCRLDGHPENIAFEGAPMWQSYRDAAAVAVDALGLEPLLAIVRELAEPLTQTAPKGGIQDRARGVLARYEG